MPSKSWKRKRLEAFDRALSRIDGGLLSTVLDRRRIETPIFILGAPRSGTTLFAWSFLNHRDLGYFTRNSVLFPTSRICGNVLGRLLGYDRRYLRGRDRATGGPVRRAGRFRTKKTFPVEGNFSWDAVLPRGMHVRYDETDAPKVDRELLLRMMAGELLWHGASRFCNKSPSHSVRIRLLDALFPDARFIHLHRDGRAVAFSLTKLSRRTGPARWTIGPRPRGWTMDPDRTLLENCALQWRGLMKVILRDSQSLGDRIIHIGYRDFIAQPVEVVSEAWRHAGLVEDRRSRRHLEAYVGALTIESRNEACFEELEPSVLRNLGELLSPLLDELGSGTRP